MLNCQERMAIGKEGNVKWVDGLRGIASALVVLTHLTRAWDGDLFNATSAENAPPRLLQLPYLRILIQGRIGVTIFSFVTGYVCALKPIRLCSQGNQEAAFTSISRSALRRIPRLVLPAAAATAVSWAMAETGLYAVAKHQDSWFIDAQSAERTDYVGEARLLKAVFGMQFFWGTLIADLQNHTPTTQFIIDHRRLTKTLSFILLLTGLTFASFPEGDPDWMPWSRTLLDIMTAMSPENPDYPRFASAIGLECAVLGILLNPGFQKVLSSRSLLFLGRMSFAVYLLHGPLMRTTLVWMLYGVRVPPDHANGVGGMELTRLVYPGHLSLFACLVVWLPMVYGVAHLWMMYVDAWCERMSNRLVEFVVLEASEKVPVLPVN
ncbi:hypothetical protein SLS53_005609 [Cytospora paraplurivora]|uniref:Acyltransferase 3 domain-containing protein n=1 Tax=Cytospora paraplurivora TaxID=2898453 RepID=A0AAN9UBV0_9PEZI